MPRHALNDDQLATTRRRILSEAAAIISRDGYAALSMRRLATALGLTAGALYRYFPTKQHVLMAYWSGALDDLRSRLECLDDPMRPHLEVLRDMLDAYAAFGIEDKDRFRLIFMENDFGFFESFSQNYNVFSIYNIVENRVIAAAASGEMADIPPRTVCKLLWASVHGVLALGLSVPQLEFGDLSDLASLAAEICLSGIVNSKSSR
jgi:AcrR family transcriptional regulator